MVSPEPPGDRHIGQGYRGEEDADAPTLTEGDGGDAASHHGCAQEAVGEPAVIEPTASALLGALDVGQQGE